MITKCLFLLVLFGYCIPSFICLIAILITGLICEDDFSERIMENAFIPVLNVWTAVILFFLPIAYLVSLRNKKRMIIDKRYEELTRETY